MWKVSANRSPQGFSRGWDDAATCRRREADLGHGTCFVSVRGNTQNADRGAEVGLESFEVENKNVGVAAKPERVDAVEIY